MALELISNLFNEVILLISVGKDISTCSLFVVFLWPLMVSCSKLANSPISVGKLEIVLLLTSETLR